MAEHEHHEPEPEVGSDPDDDAFAAVLGEIDQGPSVQVVRSPEADELALRLVEATGATLVDDLDGLADLASDDRRGPAGGPEGSSVLCGVGDLTALARRVMGARDLVAAAVASTADRAYPSTGVALHPDSIRSAAAQVLEARADVLEAERAAGVDGRSDDEGVDAAIDPDAHPEEGETFDRFWGAGEEPLPASTEPESAPGVAEASDEGDEDGGDAWPLRRPVVLLVIWLLLGAAVFAAGGGPIALALPAIALMWIGVLVWRRRRADARASAVSEAEAEDDVAANLASVLAATDQAYDGEGGRFADPETGAAARSMAAARQRLRVAENRWRALMGPHADVHEVEDEIARRDPQHGLPPASVVDESPSVRAARHHLRRLEGRWKVAWWAMDRTPPTLDEADGAVALLRSEGRTDVVFVTGDPRSVTTVVHRSAHDVDAGSLPAIDGLRLVVVVSAADAADQVS